MKMKFLDYKKNNFINKISNIPSDRVVLRNKIWKKIQKREFFNVMKKENKNQFYCMKGTHLCNKKLTKTKKNNNFMTKKTQSKSYQNILHNQHLKSYEHKNSN